LKDVNVQADPYTGLYTALGYTFRDPALLKRALTHSSRKGNRRDYERLEFLGDRVLGLVIAHALYDSEPGLSEGEMAPRLSALVRGEMCAEVARRAGLHAYISVGAQEAAQGVHMTMTVLGDAMEAVIAAVYLESGLEAARSMILSLWATNLAGTDCARKDAKTFLQEWSLARALGIPAYRVVGREGPDHQPQFEAEVCVVGFSPARGSGASKRVAEHRAAEDFIGRERLRP
jgi:ribonuclease III